MALQNELALAKSFDKSDLAYCIIKVILDESGKPCDWEFVYLNEALAKIEGLPKEELLGRRFFEIFPNADKKWFKYYYPAAYEDQSFIFDDVSEEIGSALRIRCFPIEQGYCGCVIEDITNEFERIASKVSEMKIDSLADRDQENSYEGLLQKKMLASLGFFEAFVHTFVSSYYLDLEKGNFIAFNQDESHKEYGQYGSWDIMKDYIREKVHQDDREELRLASGVDYIRARLEKEERYSVILRDIGAGYIRWLQFQVMRGADKSHAAIGFQDITGHMLARNELLAVRDLVKAARWTIKINESGEITSIWFSDVIRAMLRYKDENDFPDSLEFWISRIHPEDRDSRVARLKSAIGDRSGNTIFDVQYRIRTKDDEYIMVRSAATINRDQNGVATDAIGIFVDVNDTYLKEERQRELEHSQERLRDALDAAEHANRAKTTFLNNMSHDIRTPMNAIIGFTSLAATHIDNKEQVVDYLGKIQTSGNHLLSLINDVLDMSRIESGNMKIEPKEVHLPDVLHDLRTIIQSSVNAKQLDIFFDTVDVVHEDVICDKLRLNQILLNIVSNSIKFTKPGGTISVRVIEKPSGNKKYANIEFRIKDTGIGMSPEFTEHIFEVFAREDTSAVRKIQGTGLGMAITKNIVDMMGGMITVASEQDKGTEVVINLPFETADKQVHYGVIPELKGARALVADDDSDNAISVSDMLGKIGMRADWTLSGKEAVLRTEVAVKQCDEYSVYLIDWMMPDLNGIETVRRIRRVIGNSKPIIILTAYDWTDIEEEAKEAGVTAFISKPMFMSELHEVLSRPFRTEVLKEEKKEKLPNFEGKRILLVEDNELNQEIAVEILSQVGFEVDVAQDGLEAFEKMKALENKRYDLILMDIQMPRLDGYETTRLIRGLACAEVASTPIIAMTANAFEEDKQNALAAGMNGHIAKPIEIGKLMEMLAGMIGVSER